MSLSLKKSNDVATREDAGVLVHLRDELNEKMFNGEGKDATPVTMTVVGSYSPTYRRAVEANRDKLLKRGRGQLDGDVLDRQSIDLLATCILEWSGLVVDGQPFLYTKANAIALLEAAPWIREQVEVATQDHAAFFSRA